jgi:hypothetical protein
MIGVLIGAPPNLFGQGLVTFLNASNTSVRTNATGLGGGAGYTSPDPNGFFYGLFIASSTVTSLSPLDLLTATWTFTGVYAVNLSVSGLLYGGDGVPVPGWDNVTNSYAVAGWSARVAKTDWSSVAAQLNAAAFTSGVWSGTNWLPGSSGGFFGVSSVGYGQAPDISRGIPPFHLFGSGTPTFYGLSIYNGWDLFVVNVPEPSMLGFAVAWSITLLLIRKRVDGRR